MRAPIVGLIALLLFVLNANMALATEIEERFESVDAVLTFEPDGRLVGRHELRVTATNDEIKRGIFLRFNDELGPISIAGVTRNAQPEPVVWQDRSEGLLRIGDADVMLPPGEHFYVLTFEVPQPFIQREGETEPVLTFRWRPFMGASSLPWVTSRLEIRWPEGAAPMGDEEAVSRSWQWRGPSGAATDGEPYEEAVRLTWRQDAFPASAVRVPSVNEWLRYGAPSALIILWFLFHSTWSQVGRDRRPGPISAHPDLPRDISPAAAHFIRTMGFGRHAVAASLLNLVVKGEIDVSRAADGKSMTLRRQDKAGSSLPAEEQALVDRLFRDDTSIDLKKGKAISAVTGGMMAMAKALKEAYRGRMYNTNLGAWGRCMVIMSIVIALLTWQFAMEVSHPLPDKLGFIAWLVLIIAAPLMSLVYVSFFKAPTREGRMVMDRVEGLKRYMESPDPFSSKQADPTHFLTYLPYAVALDVEEAWVARFGSALDDQADSDTAQLLAWYRSMTSGDDGISNTTFVAAILPAITASSAGASAGGSSAGGGASAGGW